jgi:hypothetical protein
MGGKLVRRVFSVLLVAERRTRSTERQRLDPASAVPQAKIDEAIEIKRMGNKQNLIHSKLSGVVSSSSSK